jgi:aryl-alcohol dehydrogenase-like predicted oxidoreductase
MAADAERPHQEQAELAARLTRVYQLARDLGMPVPELALRYLLSDAQIASVIPGARSVNDVRSNMRAALKGPLPADLVTDIEATHPAAESGHS